MAGAPLKMTEVFWQRPWQLLNVHRGACLGVSPRKKKKKTPGKLSSLEQWQTARACKGVKQTLASVCRIYPRNCTLLAVSKDEMGNA